jgi:hypothetical protein
MLGVAYRALICLSSSSPVSEIPSWRNTSMNRGIAPSASAQALNEKALQQLTSFAVRLRFSRTFEKFNAFAWPERGERHLLVVQFTHRAIGKREAAAWLGMRGHQPQWLRGVKNQSPRARSPDLDPVSLLDIEIDDQGHAASELALRSHVSPFQNSLGHFLPSSGSRPGDRHRARCVRRNWASLAHRGHSFRRIRLDVR